MFHFLYLTFILYKSNIINIKYNNYYFFINNILFKIKSNNRYPGSKHTPHKSTFKNSVKITPHFSKTPWEEQINQPKLLKQCL